MEDLKSTEVVNESDIPKRTVLVLLVITIVVVALGTWTVLERMNYVPAAKSPSVQGGQVGLTILPSEETSPAAEPTAAG